MLCKLSGNDTLYDGRSECRIANPVYLLENFELLIKITLEFVAVIKLHF
jgi:hypothetical protein